MSIGFSFTEAMNIPADEYGVWLELWEELHSAKPKKRMVRKKPGR